MSNKMSQTQIIRRVIALESEWRDLVRRAQETKRLLGDTVRMAAENCLGEGPYVVDDCVVTFDFGDSFYAEITPIQYTDEDKQEWSNTADEVSS